MQPKRPLFSALRHRSTPKLGQQLWEWRGVWITAPVVAAIVLAVRVSGLLQTLEWATLDEFFRQRPREAPDPAIVIIGVTESDLRSVGSYPFSDALLANLIRKIRQQQPIVIGLDLYRDLPVQPGHTDLVKVFETTPNLLGIEKLIGDAGTPPVPAAPTLKRLGQVGVNDIVADGDGKIRRGILYVPDRNGEWLESLGLRLALAYLEAQKITADPEAEHLQLGRTTFPPFQENDGGYVRADDGGYQILMNFRGPARSFRTVSVMDVLQNRIAPDLLRDRIVLIGPTASSLKDFFYTPFSSTWTDSPEQTAGVELQANLASQIINAALHDRPLIRVWATPIEWLWVLLWSGIGATLGWTFRKAAWTTVIVVCSLAALTGGSFLAFWSGWWVPVVPPVLALVGSVVIITRYIAELERTDRQTVMNLFGRHVTPQVAEAIWRDRHQILEQGRVRGQRITATVLFSDIQGFTHIAEAIESEALMDWLNEYMEAMAQLVLEHGGIVDKFIGDAVMAVFGAPIPRLSEAEITQDAQNAVRCALAMADKLKVLHERWQSQARPIASIRIGISTGTVVIGSLGSSQRLDYTIIGDSVNVASRLESYDKWAHEGSCRILISDETYQHCHGKYATQPIGSVLLRGRLQPIEVYQVLVN